MTAAYKRNRKRRKPGVDIGKMGARPASDNPRQARKKLDKVSGETWGLSFDFQNASPLPAGQTIWEGYLEVGVATVLSEIQPSKIDDRQWGYM